MIQKLALALLSTCATAQLIFNEPEFDPFIIDDDEMRLDDLEDSELVFEVDPREDFRDDFYPDGDENEGPELPDTAIEIDLDRISGLLRSQFE